MHHAAETDAGRTAMLPRVLKIRTDDWPERDRLSMFRDTVGGDQVTVELVGDQPFRIDGEIVKLPGLGLVSARRSALRSDFRDGDDRVTINLGGAALASQKGREFVLNTGDAVAFTGSEVGSVTTSTSGRLATIEFERGSLHRLLGDSAQSCARRIPARAPALLLLRRYLNAISAFDLLGEGTVRPLAVEHIHDLAALAVGAGRHAEDVAKGRGVRAARLEALREDILSRLHGELTLGDVAARHSLSPRYVRMLFESQGTSFSEFVREERLKRARHMLLSPRFDQLRISEIAFGVGFNDLSYFNRSFRGRFGMSPGELRALNQSPV
jgi:AraC-like DNA-binding protein